jgi:hypothetical protein
MSQNQTFNSRLRLLVAKSYKAERLYNSLRSEHTFENPELLARITSASGIAEIANDIRAREWQRAHNELRLTLNELLSTGTSLSQARAVAGLLETFRTRFDEDRMYVEENVENLVEATKREEFGHVLKLSLELIRAKSRSQASKAIADELNAVLQPLTRDGRLLEAEALQSSASQQQSATPELPKNVIPLRRRAG